MCIYTHIYILTYTPAQTHLHMHSQVLEEELYKKYGVTLNSETETIYSAGYAGQQMYHQPPPQQHQTLCIDGLAHNFVSSQARNEATNRGGGLTAKVFGFGGGFKGYKKHDGGERLVIYCTKCGMSSLH